MLQSSKSTRTLRPQQIHSCLKMLSSSFESGESTRLGNKLGNFSVAALSWLLLSQLPAVWDVTCHKLLKQSAILSRPDSEC